MNPQEIEDIAYEVRVLTKRTDLPEGVVRTMSEAYHAIGELQRRLRKIESAPFMYFVKYDMVNRSTDTWMRITDEFMEDQYRVREPILAETVAAEIRRVHQKMIVYGNVRVPPTDQEMAIRKIALDNLARLDEELGLNDLKPEADACNKAFRTTDGEA